MHHHVLPASRIVAMAHNKSKVYTVLYMTYTCCALLRVHVPCVCYVHEILFLYVAKFLEQHFRLISYNYGVFFLNQRKCADLS